MAAISRNRAYLIVIFFIAFFGITFFLKQRGEKIALSYEFNGRIDNIRWDMKGFPTLTVNNRCYYLGNWNFNHSLSLRDSIIKKKNEMEIKVIQSETGIIKVYK